MEPRKIIKFGNSSYVVTLPFTWIEKNNLEKGDSINLTEKEDSIVISKPREMKETKASLSIDNKPLKLFNKELISYYLKNFKIIEITGKQVIERLDEIKRFKEKISSVEITKITKDSVILRDLTSPSELNVKKLIIEIIEMEKLLFEELRSKDIKEKFPFLVELDSNINKLSFLAHKAINYNLDSWVDPQYVKHSIHYWRIIANLEGIGDILKRIGRYLKKETQEHNHHIGNTIEKLENYFVFITKLLDETTNFEKNLELYLDKKQTLLREVEELRGFIRDDINLFLVISQLLKDIVGRLDTLVLSVMDIKLK